jgi:WD40 repeat protein
MPDEPKNQPLKINLPDYELIRLIGEGAFGQVWLARAKATGRYRAIKMVDHSKFSEEAPFETEFAGVKRFEEVSREHEGFVDILHVCRDEGTRSFAFVMELADDVEDGPQIDPATYVPRTLANDLKHRGRLPPAECVRIGVALTNALEELHRRGLVHRDIKPANIVYVRGAPRLADVGLVTEAKTEPGSIYGTPYYMDMAVHGTCQGDLYGLGKVLYVLATGAPPKSWPDWPPEIASDPDFETFKELEAIFCKACHSNPGRRYDTAQEMRADLLLLQAGHSMRRLRKLEYLAGIFHRYGMVAAGLLLLLAFGTYQYLQERVHRAELGARKVGSWIANGNHAVEKNDLLNALSWYVAAWQADQANPQNEDTHRLRLASVLQHCPMIVQMWFKDRELEYAAFAGQENQVLLPSEPGKWAICDVTGGQEILPRFGSGVPNEEMTFQEGGKLAATTIPTNNYVLLWDCQTGQQLGRLEYSSTLLKAALSRDGRRLAAITPENTVVIWDVQSRERGPVLAGHESNILHVAFSRDGRRLVSSSRDKTARVWDLASGQATTIFTNHGEWVFHAAFNQDGRLVASASYEPKVRIWDSDTGREVLPPLPHGDGVYSVQWNAEGTRVLTAGLDFVVQIWDPFANHVLHLLRHNSKPLYAAFSPSESHVLTACYDGTVRVWRVREPGQLVPERTAYAETGPFFARMTNDAVFIHNATNAAITAARRTGELPFETGFSSDGSRLLVVSTAAPPATATNLVARLWDCGSGYNWGQPISLDPVLNQRIVSSNGAYLCAFGEAGGRVWDFRDGRVALVFTHDVGIAAFAPVGDRLAIAFSNTIQVWNLERRQPALPGLLTHESVVKSLGWSRDGHYLVAAGWERDLQQEAARIWDSLSGAPVGKPLQHLDGVRFAAFSPGGQSVITCSEDFTAMLWDFKTSRQLVPPLAHKHQVMHASFSEDGRWVATGCKDGTARIWDTHTGEAVTVPLFCDKRLTSVQLSKQALRLTVSLTNGWSVAWPLPQESRPVGDLVLMAQLLSGQAAHSTEALMPQSKAAISNAWIYLRPRYPDDFSLRPPSPSGSLRH